MFIADQTGGVIYSVPLTNVADTFPVLPLENLGQPTALAIDQIGEMLYWTEVDNNTISRSHLNGSGQEVFLGGLQGTYDNTLQMGGFFYRNLLSQIT